MRLRVLRWRLKLWRRRAQAGATALAGAELLARAQRAEIARLRGELADTQIALGSQRVICEELGERADAAESELRRLLRPVAQA